MAVGDEGEERGSLAPPRTISRAQAASMVMAALVVMSVPFCVQYLALEMYTVAVSVAAAALLGIGNIVVLRRTKRLQLTGQVGTALLFFLLLISNLSSGGFHDPNFSWFYVVQVVAAIFLDLRSVVAWSVVVVFTAVGFWALPYLGVELASQIPADSRASHALANRISALVAVAAVVALMTFRQRRNEASLRLTNRDLRAKTEHIRIVAAISEVANRAESPADGVVQCLRAVGEGIGADRAVACRTDGTVYAEWKWTEAPPAAVPGTLVRLDREWQMTVSTPSEGALVLVLRMDAGQMPEESVLSGIADHVRSQLAHLFQREAAAHRIRDLAFFDPLTGLPNRTRFRSVLGRAIDGAERAGSQLGLLFLDLDRFKEINDSLGHSAGDDLLVRVAEALAGCTRGGDCVGRGEGEVSRLGGDEFTVLLPNIDAPGDAAAVARRLIETVQTASGDHHTTASIGVALYPDDGTTVEALLQNADTAMYAAKRSGGDGFSFYSAHMNADSRRRLDLDRRLRSAVPERLSVHYQPLVGSTSHRISAVEALVRWEDEELGRVSPTEFIPVAEAVGLIDAIGEFALRRAAKDAARWIEQGYGPISVSVNVSGRQLRQPNFVAVVDTILAESNLPPRFLRLEITESVTVDKGAAGVLARLSDMGVSISLDDFGTGYSSLSHLRRLPIDCLKIDRSFVASIHQSSEDRNMVRAIVLMARALGLSVVAEGVEEQAQADILRTLHCDELQGYFFGRPVPREALEERLLEQRPKTRSRGRAQHRVEESQIRQATSAG
ncbi:MAG: EAL domain-containing protein [Myxococcota bacterium]